MSDGGTGVPDVARMYDYLLGGSHNFQADRDRAQEVLAVAPSLAEVARANRTFLRHAVEHALDLGIRQFLDLGSGVPTVGNVHEIAHRRDPRSRVAYVDNEPVAVTRSRTVLTDIDGATITDLDIRDPDVVREREAVVALYASSSNPAHDRSRAEILTLVETAGFAVDSAGLIELGHWRQGPQDGPVGGYALISEPL